MKLDVKRKDFTTKPTKGAKFMALRRSRDETICRDTGAADAPPFVLFVCFVVQ